MKMFRRQSLAEQAAEHIRMRLRHGHWGVRLPGVQRLADETGVSKVTVRAALRRLESEGWLEAPRPGCRRAVAPHPKRKGGGATMRVAILLNEPVEQESAEVQRLLLDIQHGIEGVGHHCFFTDSNLARLRGDVRRIARHVKNHPADAWIVFGGPRHVLAWFAAQPAPALALGGRSSDVPISAAGNDICAPLAETVRKLAAMGHRKIVMICPEPWRKPHAGRPAQAFLDELQANGITAGEFNLPDWDDRLEGFHDLLNRLFRTTPPTALLTTDPKHTCAALSFLARHGLKVGSDVSLVAMMADPNFAWNYPPLARFVYDLPALLRGIVRWVNALSRGHRPLKRILIPARFEAGGTLGPAPDK